MGNATHKHAVRPEASAGAGARGAVLQPKRNHWQTPDQAPDNPQRLSSGVFQAPADPNTGHRFAHIPVRPPLPLPVQAKLTVSAPDDKYEQEADRVADAVMRMPETTAAGRPNDDENKAKPDIQTNPLAGKFTPLVYRENVVAEYGVLGGSGTPQAKHARGTGLEHELRELQRSGQPLPDEARTFFEPRFGHDFGQVRVHTDHNADRLAHTLSANAFTIGKHIAFREGRFSSRSPAGQRLLAHELTHVVQQNGASAVHGAAADARAPQTSVGVQRDATNQSLEIAELQPGYTPGATEAEQTFTPAASGTSATPAETIPEGGERVDRFGIVSWDREPEVKLRSSPDTRTGNIVTTLAFNTHVQVIKRFPGDWFFVSTQSGDLGYVASTYVWTDLPEPNANLHRVKPGTPGTAIAIAERHYKAYADDWGQDLRFYVNVLAWANHKSVPNTTSGWRQVHFQAGDLIWIPSHEFARSLRGVVNSGSLSYNIADAVGVASFAERAAELWDDFWMAISLSGKYLGAAIARHVEQALWNVLEGLAVMLVAAVAILAISTAVGAALGALAGGAGAAPGAAAGFQVGMVLLEWLGLAMLVVWIGQALLQTGSAFGRFLGMVWDARGDRSALDRAAQQFAEAVGVLLGNLLEGLAMYAVSMGLIKGIGALRGSRIGKAMGETRAGKWLGERVRRVSAGETPIVGPRRAFARFYRGVEIVDGRGSPLGEFDGVDMTRQRLVENKSASGLDRINPRTGRPQQTPAEWAQRQILAKTATRIANLARAVATRATGGGSSAVPTLAEVQGIRHIHFVIDANTPALRAAVFAEMANLRAAHPGWTFTAEFGVSVYIPPVPDVGTDPESEGK